MANDVEVEVGGGGGVEPVAEGRCNSGAEEEIQVQFLFQRKPAAGRTIGGIAGNYNVVVAMADVGYGRQISGGKQLLAPRHRSWVALPAVARNWAARPLALAIAWL